MHTVELLEAALAAAGRPGYKIREDWLGDSMGGGCELRGQKWIFLDLALSPLEKLDCMIDALRGDPGLARMDLPVELTQLLNVRKTA